GAAGPLAWADGEGELRADARASLEDPPVQAARPVGEPALRAGHPQPGSRAVLREVRRQPVQRVALGHPAPSSPDPAGPASPYAFRGPLRTDRSALYPEASGAPPRAARVPAAPPRSPPAPPPPG